MAVGEGLRIRSIVTNIYEVSMTEVVLSMVLMARDMERHHASCLVKNACCLLAHWCAIPALWAEVVWECKVAAVLRALLELLINKILRPVFIVHRVTWSFAFRSNQCSIAP